MNLRFLISMGVGLIAAVIIILTLLLVTNANAGQTEGFAPYARQGIVNELNRIYGKGTYPYTVRCTEQDQINYSTGAVHDTVTCTIVSR